MPTSLILACIWVLGANLLAMTPSGENHWRAAYVLIAVGIPILGWVTYTSGPFWGLLVFAGAASILRWPLIRLWRWARHRVVEPAE